MILGFILNKVGYKTPKQQIQDLQNNDERFKNSKLFSFEMDTNMILISESGFISLYSGFNKLLKKTYIFHLNDIRGFEVLTNGNMSASIGGAVVGGLLFGSIGSIIGGQSVETINTMSLIFKTNNFDMPTIEFPIIQTGTTKGAIEKKVLEVTSTLEFVERKIKDQT